MTDLLLALVGVMLLCIPVSLIISLAYTADRYPGDLGALCLFWFLAYVTVILSAAVVFAGIAGVAVLTEAFR